MCDLGYFLVFGNYDTLYLFCGTRNMLDCSALAKHGQDWDVDFLCEKGYFKYTSGKIN